MFPEELNRGPGRPRKIPVADILPVSADITVRMGPKPCMTSKGMSAPGQRLYHGIIVDLPRDEAENLINLGYATHV